MHDMAEGCAECGRAVGTNPDNDCCADCEKHICERRGIRHHGEVHFPLALAAAKASRELAELDQGRWPMTAMRLREIIRKGTPDD